MANKEYKYQSDEFLTLIPAYNSASTLSSLLLEVKKHSSNILVIDDGSVDRTKQVCLDLGIEIISHDLNVGLSQAMKTAFNYANENNYKYILALDSDGQHDPACIPDFIKISTNSDLVIGNRFAEIRNIPSMKIASNLFASSVFQEVFGRFIPDVTCGYRCYKVSSFSDCKFGENFEFIFHSLAHVLSKNLSARYCKVPVIYQQDRLLATCKKELISFLNVVLSYKEIGEIRSLLENIYQANDFNIIVQNTTFYGYYLEKIDSYLMQCDLLEASKKYHLF